MHIIAFYQSAAFEGERGRPIHHKGPHPNVEIMPGGDPMLRRRMTAFFDEVSFERVGTLRGEYILEPTSVGLVLIDRHLHYTLVSCAWEDMPVEQMLPFLRRPEFQAQAQALVDRWDSLPVSTNQPLAGHPYGHNYFHFTFDAAANLRLFDQFGNQPLIVPEKLYRQPFQREIWAQVARDRSLQIQSSPLRVVDPIVAQTRLSADAIRWMRDTVKFRAVSGDRRIFIRRKSLTRATANQGSIAETPEFLAFLSEHRFEFIDFGEGDMPLAQQVKSLDGADIILSSHGANLTNLTYAPDGIRVIEIATPDRANSFFAYICSVLGFKYFGIPQNRMLTDGTVAPPMDALRQVMAKIGPPGATP